MKIFNKFLAVSVLLSMFCIASVSPVAADQQASTGQQLAEKWQKSIVTVQLVVKTSISYEGEDGGKRESKTEATGTVIDPSGLVVMSLSTTSPEEAMGLMGGYDEDVKITSEITDIKIITSEGKEIPAKIVLRDRDLDLAFIRPKEKLAEPMQAIDMTKTSKLNQFDESIIIYRLGTTANRSLAGVIDRVQSVIQKPRLQYAMGIAAMSASLGAPVFAMDSNVVGMLLLRSQPAGVTDNSGALGGLSGMGMMYIVLPAEDIAGAAKQAPQ